MGRDRLILIGVRHHSPACAKLVRETILEQRPAYVLVEGPADYNPHIEDLKRPHALPIAIFSYAADADAARSSYSPFCAYSPEWQALQSAWEIGAKPLFCDLPAWHPDFDGRDNRYADPSGLQSRYGRMAAALEHRLGSEGADAVWDSIAEQTDPTRLAPVLSQYFEALRPEGTIDPREMGRETFMARYAAWALQQAGDRPVVLVCGGWHVGGIRMALQTVDGSEPVVPQPAEDMRAASYLTPFSYERLDRFNGYAAGMPSPGYYAKVFEHDLDAAAEWAFAAIATALKKTEVRVSTADRIAWHANAAALARLRGHRAPLRADILDAALATLVKDALTKPAAWTRSGDVQRADDAVVVAMIAALRGSAQGKLAAGTRQPPLVGDVKQRLHAHDLIPQPKPKSVLIDWHTPEHRPRARTLHQLRVLEIPGFVRTGGATSADTRNLREAFEITQHSHMTGALIEAARWGGELPMAAAARLTATIAEHTGDMGVLAKALSDGLFAGLFDLARSLVLDLAGSVAACSDIAELGAAAKQIWRLHRYGDVFGETAVHDLAPMCEAVFERVLWLCEGAIGDADAHKALEPIIVLRDIARSDANLAIDRVGAAAVFARLLSNPKTPPALAGASLGYLTAVESEADTAMLAGRIQRFGTPEALGDFLAGLFALARETLAKAGDALAAIDVIVADWTDDDFLRALPSMRDAFAWFPPREREALAKRILQGAGFDLGAADIAARAWMRQTTPLLDQAAALAREQRVSARLARYGFDL